MRIGAGELENSVQSREQQFDALSPNCLRGNSEFVLKPQGLQ
jgi:hypothetical protein